MSNQVICSAQRTTLSLRARIVFATAGLMVLAAAWSVAAQSPAALGAESPSALKSDPQGWVDILPAADLKDWYRVPVPPTGKLGRQQWHVDAGQKTLVCDGDGGHDMLLLDK